MQRDIAYNPTTGYFYGAAASTTVFEMDFTPGSEALVSTIIAPTAIRAIGCDDVNQFLFGNNWSTAVNIFNLSGAVQSTFAVGPVGASYYGFAFDNYSTGGPFIWGYAQIDVSLEWLIQMTYPGGVETGITYDVGTALGHAVGNLAGGLAITPPGTFPSVAPGEWSIFGINQNVSMWALELDNDLNPCQQVTDIVPSNVTSSSMDIGWTENGAATSWEVEYGIAGFTQGTGTTISPATNPQAITGLSAATAYDFYVRADCGGGSYSGWASATFTTAGDCEWYVIGYDSYGDGWNGGSVTMLLNGNQVLNWAGPATTGPETVYFPMVDGSTLDVVWTPGSWDSEVTYEVYDNTDVLVFSDGPNPIGTTGIAGYCTAITCPAPTNVMASNLTGTTADLSWDDANAANTYDIVWGAPGFDPLVGPYTGTAYGETYPGAPYTYQITGLTLNDSYDAFVRASCGPGDVSIYVKVSFVSAPPPANDDCVNAELVTGPYPQTVNGTTFGATVDCPGVLDWNAVWYEVTLPYTLNNMHVDYCGTDDQATIGIVYYNDCSDCSAYVIADAYSFYDCGIPGGVTVGQMDFLNIPGPGTIFFPAYMLPQMDFIVEFDVTELVLPPNDDCANAEPIGEVVDLPFNTSFATADTYGSCMTSANLWYNYTATTDGNLTVSLCGSSFDTKLALYDAFDCGTMVALACNDDACGLQSEIVWGPVTAGETFKIEVGGYGTAVGAGILNVSVVPPMYDIGGTITYANPGMTAMDAVTVELTGYGTSQTDGSGMYSGIMAPDGNYTLMSSTTKLHGGSNGLDVILTKRYIATLHTFTPIQLMAADVNQNGGADGLDVIMMKRRIASLTYPAWTAPDYIFYDQNVTIAGAPVVADYQALCSGDVNGSHTPEFQIPANDDCATPVAVTGPYPVTGIVGTTEFATESCPTYLPMASGEVWYAIDLPYASNQIVIDLCGDALLDNGWIVGTTVQCSCDGADYLTGGGFTFTAPCVTGLTWIGVPGPGTFYYPVATGSFQEGFTLDVDVTEYIVSGYCTTTVTTPCGEWIGDVICGTINNLANGCSSGYEDFTAQSTSIAAGASEAITVNNGGAIYSGDFVTCWVDWGNDFIFDQGGNEEFILTSDGTGAQFTGNITVPVGTPAGTYTMRVRMSWNTGSCPLWSHVIWRS
ncbi:MAG: GEVED domain-containing protein [Bacteroidales bacterium]